MRALLLPRLFGDAVASAEVDPFADLLTELLPEEAAGVPHGHPLRILEYRGGRHCARAALRLLGRAEGPILRAPDRSPIWPPGVAGSISHTRAAAWGFCGAIVAPVERVHSLGLDVELDEPLERKLWGRVLTDAEQGMLEERPESQHGYLGKLLFSAKEAVYKCQHPLSGEFLEFHDVQVTLGPAGLVASLQRDAGPLARGTPFEVRFVRERGLIVTATMLPA